ncbi:MAG: hypothetical protein IKM43_00380 [Clostridia bacterium]|nr:hypothetical protein [Clostridia bacterium]
MKLKDTIFYKNENDEVLDFKINSKPIDKNYQYIHKNLLYRFISFLTYRIIAMPFVWVHFKLFKRIKFKNRKVLKTVKGSYFVYANHTNQYSDSISPTFICFPHKPYVIVNRDNVYMPLWGKFARMWGALPLPDTIDATKNFKRTMDYYVSNNRPIIIYPEAHLWPYYTKIRDFSEKSFRYPVEYNKPIFTFTTTYHKRKYSKKPRIEIYIDGPYFVEEHLDKQQKKQQLRDVVYQQMKKRTELNTYEFVKYVNMED